MKIYLQTMRVLKLSDELPLPLVDFESRMCIIQQNVMLVPQT